MPHLLIVDLSACTIGVLFRKWSPMPMRFNVLRFSVSGFMLRSLIHLDLSFVQGDRYGSIYILLHANLLRPAPFLEDAFLFPWYISGFFIENQVSSDLHLSL